MTLLRKFCILAGLLSVLVTGAQEDILFHSLVLGQPLDSVAIHLTDRAATIRKYTPEEIRFPLARKMESHWVVEEFRSDQGVIQRMALVFADGRLAFIQAEGGTTAILSRRPDSTFATHEAYRFYEADGIVARPDMDKAWKLDPAGMHLNLFAWDHPMLLGSSWPDYSWEVAIPEALKMGASLEELEPLLLEASAFIYRMDLDGSDPNAQLQLDCFGMAYAGFSRKAEARFGDGKLNTVWILTAKPEEARLRALLTDTYGKPVFVSDDWEAFENWQVFLRKDKPEILFLTEALGAYYKKEFFGQ